MPIEKLDEKTALVVIDLQKGIVAMAKERGGDKVVSQAAILAKAFRAKNLPVILVHVNGRAPGRTEAPGFKLPAEPDWSEIVPDMEPQKADLIVTKQRLGAFVGTELGPYLQKQGITQIVLAGISTGSGVESTARSLYDAGYTVSFAIDAITDRDPDTHRFCLEKVFPRLGETGDTKNIIQLLGKV